MGDSSRYMQGLLDRIDNSFKYHPPSNEDVANTHDQIREATMELARVYAHLCPASMELDRAIFVKLEEAMFLAIASVARYMNK